MKQGCGGQFELGWAVGAACGATGVWVLLLYPGSREARVGHGLGERLGGIWVYLGVSQRESLIALGRWPD